jgi:hypothetical protein
MSGGRSCSTRPAVACLLDRKQVVVAGSKDHIVGPGARPHPAGLADEEGARRHNHPRLQTARHHDPVWRSERRKPLANGAGLTHRSGNRLARLDGGGGGRAGAVADVRGKANAGDQRREDERY